MAKELRKQFPGVITYRTTGSSEERELDTKLRLTNSTRLAIIGCAISQLIRHAASTCLTTNLPAPPTSRRPPGGPTIPTMAG